MAYEGTPGCRQGRNNVRLTEKLVQALRESDNVMDRVELRLENLASDETFCSDIRFIIRDIKSSLSARIRENHPVHVEHHDTLE